MSDPEAFEAYRMQVDPEYGKQVKELVDKIERLASNHRTLEGLRRARVFQLLDSFDSTVSHWKAELKRRGDV